MDDDTPHPYSCDTKSLSCLEDVTIGQIAATNPDNKITLYVNNQEMKLYVDSGCKKTIIPSSQYSERLGKMKPRKTRFRPNGTPNYLTTLGEVPVTLQSSNGAELTTTIYVVQGHKVEPLLGDVEAKALGILTINKWGYKAQTLHQPIHGDIGRITANIQAAGIQIQSEKDPESSQSLTNTQERSPALASLEMKSTST